MAPTDRIDGASRPGVAATSAPAAAVAAEAHLRSWLERPVGQTQGAEVEALELAAGLVLGSEWSHLDGVLDESTQRAVGAALSPDFEPLQLGDGYRSNVDRRDEVVRLQRSLNAVGASLETDGKLGSGTVEAIRDFQRRAGLPITGRCGRDDRLVLFSGIVQRFGGARAASSTEATPAPWWASGVTAPDGVRPGGAMPDGERLARLLEVRGFERVGSDHGVTRMRGPVEGYPRPVNIFIPANFERSDAFDLALHLHGFTSGKEPNAPGAVFDTFDFHKILEDAGGRALLVVPESSDRCAAYNQVFESDAGTRAFFDGLSSVLAQSGAVRRVPPQSADAIARMTLTVHSGGYRPLGMLSQRDLPLLDRVCGVALLDATYTVRTPELLANWAERMVERGGRFESWVLRGTTTDQRDDAVMRNLRSRGVRFVEVPAAELEGESALPRFVRETSSRNPDYAGVDSAHNHLVNLRMAEVLGRLLR
jgi:hypothetical protein